MCYHTYTSRLSRRSLRRPFISATRRSSLPRGNDQRRATNWETSSWGALHAYRLSAFIASKLRYRAVPLARQLAHKRFVHPGPLVLGAAPLKSPAPTPDRDRTVSRRSEPSSRTALMGEQPNPWNLLQLQDAMSRHRGAKPRRRYELLAAISLLSPAYLLFVERWPFHSEPPDH